MATQSTDANGNPIWIDDQGNITTSDPNAVAVDPQANWTDYQKNFAQSMPGVDPYYANVFSSPNAFNTANGYYGYIPHGSTQNRTGDILTAAAQAAGMPNFDFNAAALKAVQSGGGNTAGGTWDQNSNPVQAANAILQASGIPALQSQVIAPNDPRYQLGEQQAQQTGAAYNTDAAKYGPGNSDDWMKYAALLGPAIITGGAAGLLGGTGAAAADAGLGVSAADTLPELAAGAGAGSGAATSAALAGTAGAAAPTLVAGDGVTGIGTVAGGVPSAGIDAVNTGLGVGANAGATGTAAALPAGVAGAADPIEGLINLAPAGGTATTGATAAGFASPEAALGAVNSSWLSPAGLATAGLAGAGAAAGAAGGSGGAAAGTDAATVAGQQAATDAGYSNVLAGDASVPSQASIDAANAAGTAAGQQSASEAAYGDMLQGDSVAPSQASINAANAAGTQAAIGGAATTAGKSAASAALSNILAGNGTAADYASLLGQAAPGLLGAYGASQQSSALSGLANQYWNAGAPSRSRYEASMTAGFDPTTIPGYSGALDSASQSAMRALSTGGNPYGNPGGLEAAQKQIINGTALPAVQNYQAQNANTGGYGALNGAYNQTATQAIGSNSAVLSSLGSAAGNVLNPSVTSDTLANYLKTLVNSGGTSGGASSGSLSGGYTGSAA